MLLQTVNDCGDWNGHEYTNIKRTRACTSVSTKYMRRMLLHGRDAHFFNYKTAKALLWNAPMQKFTRSALIGLKMAPW